MTSVDHVLVMTTRAHDMVTLSATAVAVAVATHLAYALALAAHGAFLA